MNTVVVALGSNIAPKENIPKAKEILANQYKLLAESGFITTKPFGDVQQPDFLNGAVLLQTSLSLDQLKSGLKKIEGSLGRGPLNRKGPRTIDLDIVIWNDKIIDPDFYERDYLKQAALELMPNLKY